MRRAVAVLGVLAATVAVAGCDSTDGQKTPPPSTSSTPTGAPTVTLASNTDVTVKKPPGSLSAQQQQVLTTYSEFVSAHYRFYSHPWFIDPVYARIVLPKTPYAPLESDIIGQIGPVVVQVLAVNVAGAKQATVQTCVDERALRYLGRDGQVDITGPAGDRLRGGVAWETISLEYTTAAAEDGSRSDTARWLISNGGSTAGAKQCQALAALPPATATPRTPVTATP